MGKLAIKGGKPVRTEPFPGWPVYDKSEEQVLLEVLHSRKWWYGAKVKEFEEKFARFQGAKYGITCSNGTVAIEIALLILGIGPGDEVIVPAYTFVATASSVLRANAVPVFVDVQADTFNINPQEIEKAITKRTKAIIPVHFAGLPAEMDKIRTLAKKYKLKIMEDTAHAWGSQWKGQGVGALGEMGTFSFQASKNITCAEGGIILTNDEELADLTRSYTNSGRGKNAPWYEHYILGGNYRLTEFQAGLLLCQLKRLPRQMEIRAENARYLDKKLALLPGIKVLKNDPRVTRRSYHLYVFRYLAEEFGGVSREKFLSALKAEGIPAGPGYPFPVYKNPLFSRKGKGPKFCPLSCPFYGKEVDYTLLNCPVAEKISTQQAVWLRQEVLLGTQKDRQDIVNAIYKIKENLKEII